MIKKIKKEQLLIGVLAGILLLVIGIPVPKTNDEKIEPEQEVVSVKAEKTMEEQLREILETISGVGSVQIFITYQDYGKVVVEKDETVSEEQVVEADSNGGTRSTTTIQNERQTVFDSEESPYVVQEFPPTIEGMLVVAQGAGNVSVKKQIQETIEALFGLDAHKISIMKMEVSK